MSATDLVWCEGAAYLIGVGRALAGWREVLRPGGRLAFTEAVWLRDPAPAEVRACWDEYPAMSDASATRNLAACRQEIDIFRRHGDCYGYQFFVAKKPGGDDVA
ncbi:MAG: hypothetical protein ACNA7W_13745 [Pseudomonadales bacterium]